MPSNIAYSTFLNESPTILMLHAPEPSRTTSIRNKKSENAIKREANLLIVATLYPLSFPV
jgi:hypothetical protein